MKKISIPIDEKAIIELKAGDEIYLSGKIFTARDMAHKRLCDLIEKGINLPFEIKESIIYYAGPTPEKTGDIVGSIGPTTSCRMDKYTPKLLDLGLRGMIGKGDRSEEVIKSIIKNKAIYFAAIGGAAALLSKAVKYSRLVCWEELGTEAIRELYVENLPLIVAIDCYGNDLYKIGPNKYRILY